MKAFSALISPLRFFLMVCFATMAAAVSAQCKLAPMTTGSVFALPEMDSVIASVKFTNYGSTPVTDFDYTLYYMDTQETTAQQHVVLDTPLEDGETTSISIKLRSGKKLGSSDVVLNVAQVNGGYNATSVPYTYITLHTVSVMPRKRVLVEDYTGMWCGNCPRGIVIMEHLRRIFPDSFVGIAIHCGDALDPRPYGYDNMERTWGPGKPSVWCGRRNKLYNFDSTTDFLTELNVMPVANIEVEAKWNVDSTDIAIHTLLTPCIGTTDDNTYSLAYALIENGMKNSNWTQTNYFDLWENNTLELPEMEKFRNSGMDVSGLTYDHVVHASLGISSGIEGSVPQKLEPNHEVEHDAAFTKIRDLAHIQCLDSLMVCAILLNTTTGKVENVAQCAIVSSTATGIHALPALPSSITSSPEEHFSIDGRRISASAPGFHLVRQKDGKVVKVWRGK